MSAAITSLTLADYRVLVVPGLHGSEASHWQSRWERLYPAFERVQQDDWETPDLPRWSQRLQQVLQASSKPTIIVAHSFGCLTTVHHATQAHPSNTASGNIAAALLVAPADPEKFNVVTAVQHPLPFPSLLVASSDDPWMSAARAQHWSTVWHSEFLLAGALGHINAHSGLGDWIAGQVLLLDLVEKAASHHGY